MTPAAIPELRADGGARMGAAVARLWELTLLLRRECPWDRAQDAATIVPHTLEEAYEVADVARRATAGDADALAELEDELGDLLFQVSFLAMWCGEQRAAGDADGPYDLGSSADRIFAKLVRRHPHVFGDEVAAGDADEVRGTWERVKREGEQRGLFDGIPDAMPAVTQARKVQSRAAGVGFDYGTARIALDDLQDEVDELRAELDRLESAGTGATASEQRSADPRVEQELGDVLYAAVNVARLARVDPELALGDATRTFRDRVERAVELAGAHGEDWQELELDAQEAWYQRAKADLAATSG